MGSGAQSITDEDMYRQSHTAPFGAVMVTSTDEVTSIIPKRLSTLKKYFENLTISDLGLLNEELIQDYAEPKDKLLMKLLYEDHLKTYVGKRNPYIPSHALKMYPELKNGKIETCFGETWKPSSVYKVQNNTGILDVPANKLKVGRLDLSSKFLVDHNMAFVCETAEKLTHLKMIDLKNNRIRGETCTKALLRLSELVDYIDITHNPIASLAGINFYQRLEEKHFQKCIWIEQTHLTCSDNWKTMVEPRFISIIKSTHNKYYSLTQFSWINPNVN